MRYALLCYDSDDIVGALTTQQEEDVYARHAAVEKELADKGRLGPNLSLMPTSAAMTVRSGGEPAAEKVESAIFAESKGTLVIICPSNVFYRRTVNDGASPSKTLSRRPLCCVMSIPTPHRPATPRS
jgi:hypothetical protein